ncbi:MULTISPECIES: SDR family oxidoreductase [Catenuloplanes]|uniref:NADP-dependent 3-hydroxy acid dehydrogenase YdfG n=1 Tax=Catenuloplanes niger TaxID=587534 RepID=A0AAE3ZJ04_9ACTN|nr:SDR family oxidoreductase [Catenuloplanes niger]MDR7320809.1 NADP-dependent 3-hydroxy acid dehydrogenase YdfG [Catenuloplanes niger]
MSTVLTGSPLSGRIAVVTGASSGIGEATAERLAVLGANVALLARREDRLTAAVARITERGGHALAVPTDVTDRAALARAVEAVHDEFGTVDLVFANAGVQHVSPIGDLTIDDWDEQINLNVKGVMNTVQAFVHDLESAAAAGGSADLIFTSSIAATRVLEKFQVYSGTKAYLSHLARVLRTELGRKKVRVSAVEPGMVDTELPLHVTDPDATKLMADLIKQIDVLQSADIAETVAFLASVPKHVNLTEITILPTEQII